MALAQAPQGVNPLRRVRRLNRAQRRLIVHLLIVLVLIVPVLAAPVFTDFNPRKQNVLERLTPAGGELRDGRIALLGTDQLGRDIFSRILYGGRVTLWVNGDDESLAEAAPKVPSIASPSHGKPFLEICEAAGRDFYKIDPLLFSPAEVIFHNIDTGRVHRAGQIAPDVLRRSFGL